MNPLNLLKANFAVNLEKQGSSLMELEQALSSVNTEEGISKSSILLKKAFLDKLNPVDLASKGAYGYIGAAVGTGYMGASAIEKMDGKVGDENKKLQSYKNKISLLEKLTKKVQQENN